MLSLGATTKKALRGLLRRFGCDIAPFPLESWYLLRNDLLALFADLKVDCVLDVGAHTGEYGSFLRDIGYKGFIVSFEPVPENYAELKVRSRRDPKWRVLPYALGEENTSRAMHVTGSTVFSSFLSPNRLGTDLFSTMAEVKRTEVVEVRRLDSILSECVEGIHDPRIYLKMDTQGWDIQVLVGASGVLDRVLALQSEISVQNIYSGMPGYLESLSLIGRMGFKPVGFIPVSRDIDHGVIEFDCVMVRSCGCD
jgi:FkbM family methyltransferase